jgi:hypothetical protein
MDKYNTINIDNRSYYLVTDIYDEISHLNSFMDAVML